MKSWFLALLFACYPISAQQIYDLLLRNGRVIDPANDRDAQLDVAVIGNRIARVAQNLPAAHARIVVDAGGYLITPGLIDINTHLGADLKPDYNTLPYGVTTAVDAGSATCQTFADFKKQVIDRAKVRVLAFISATDIECTSRVVLENRQTIVGIVTTPPTLKGALAAARASGAVMMMAGGDAKQLRPADIVTRVYGLATPRAAIEAAQRRGVFVDSPLGSDGLWFRIAQPAVDQRLYPNTISSGMDRDSVVLPRANLGTSMSIFLNLGMTEEEIIERVTTDAARAIKEPELGTLNDGAVADLAVLEIQHGKFGFLDSGHARLDGSRRFNCVLTVRNGIVVWDGSGLSIPDTLRAGPYTNFK